MPRPFPGVRSTGRTTSGRRRGCFPPGLWTFDQRATLKIPPGAGNKVYQYTAALVSANNQVVSIKQSDLFILV
jgi:hypothetical protein